MKVIIELELEIDGEYRESDKTLLLDKICENCANVLEIEEDRLIIFPNINSLELIN